DADESSLPPPSGTGLTAREERLLSVVLVDTAESDAEPDARTIAESEARAHEHALREVCSRHGAELWPLARGAFFVVMSQRGPATDQAAARAACALAIRDAMPTAKVVLTTGRAEAGRGLPLGPVIDRAAELLRDSSTGSGERGVRLDDATASL